MGREVNRRNFKVSKVTKAREVELKSLASEVSDRLPGAHRVKIKSLDATTGNPSLVASESAPAEKGNYIERTLNHVTRISRALGFTETQPTEFVAAPNIQETSSGGTVLPVVWTCRPVISKREILVKQCLGISL